MPPPFIPFDTRYSPHIDLTMHPITGVVSITVAFHPQNHGANCKLWELAPPYTGQPVVVRDWHQGQPGMLGPFGHGASLVLPTGALLVATPLGLDSAENVTPTLMLEPGYAAPYVLGGQPGPPGPPGPAGAGGITIFDVPLSAPAWTARQFSGGELVDIPAVFGAPVASVYLLRLAAQASAPNVTLRAGSQAAPYIATVTTQVAGVRVDNQGVAPGPQCYVSVVGGVATCWVQVVGWA